MVREDIMFKKIGTWTVIKNSGGRNVYCQCDCGYCRSMSPEDVFVIKCPIIHDERAYEYGGKTLTLIEWAKVVPIPYPVLYCRIYYGNMTIQDCLEKGITQEEIDKWTYTLTHPRKKNSPYDRADELKGWFTQNEFKS